MNASIKLVPIAVFASTALLLPGCHAKHQEDAAPPPAHVVELHDMNLITVDPQEQAKFQVVSAESVSSYSQVDATGTISPDVAREVPVISLVNGRVVDIKARLDDNVHKGQLLFRVQSPDITGAFNAYQKAENDEHLAHAAFLRATDLFQHGAISQAMEEQAENAERDACADLNAAGQQLAILGVDKKHPSSVMNVYAPISGVVITQNVTNASAAGVALSGSATAFTIADLGSVWVLCDVYENDLPKVKLGQEARITVNGYPDRPLSGVISDIGPVLDPSLRTAKVRVEVKNPGFLKLGMFATASFVSKTPELRAAVPADAVLHLHDRSWVFVPAGGNHLRRVEVRTGSTLPNGRQEILSGIAPGQRVVNQALMLDAAENQQ
jgi:membrane fusion protein, heavy metal efflux system